MRGGFGVAIFLLLDIENLHSQGGKASGMHVSESSGRCRGSAGWTKKGGMRERGKGNSLPDADCRITVSSSQIASRLPELTMRLSDAILEPLWEG
jgi:hypothetical protein